MLSQQLLPVAAQSVEVVTGQLAHRQRLERRVEVMRALKAQQGLLEVAPSADLWWGAGGG